MTYKTRMKEYLEGKGLLKEEEMYQEDLMTDITIQAFEEFEDKIESLTYELDQVDEELTACQDELKDAEDLIKDIKLMLP